MAKKVLLREPCFSSRGGPGGAANISAKRINHIDMSCYMTYNKDKNNKLDVQELKQMKQIRSWLKKLRRESHNMTQEQLARKVGISRTMIAEIENGNANPSVGTAKKIAAVLGFDWVRFFEDDDEQEVV